MTTPGIDRLKGVGVSAPDITRLREVAEGEISARRETLSPATYLGEGTERYFRHIEAKIAFADAFTAETVLALLDKLERAETLLKPFARVQLGDDLPEGALIRLTAQTHGACHLDPDDFRAAASYIAEGEGG